MRDAAGPPESMDALFAEARKGSKAAFSALVRIHHARVRAYLGRYVHDKDAADDLAQETFLTAYQKFATYRGEAPLGLWFIGIGRNVALRFLHEEERRRSHATQLLESAMARWFAEQVESDVGDLPQRELEAAALERCIEKLPPASASLVAACYSANAGSAAEIARRSGKKEGTVRVALLRIRQALRRCIEGQLAGQGASS